MRWPSVRCIPSQCTSLSDTIGPVVLGDVDDDIMLDQYLCSPLPSPSALFSADNAASELSGSTLVNTEHYQRVRSEEPPREPFRELSRVEPLSPDPEHAPEKQEVGYQENISYLNSGPYIRLRVSQPQITLRLKLPVTRQDGMKKSMVGKTKTGRKGTRQWKGENGIKGGRRARKGQMNDAD